MLEEGGLPEHVDLAGFGVDRQAEVLSVAIGAPRTWIPNHLPGGFVDALGDGNRPVLPASPFANLVIPCREQNHRKLLELIEHDHLVQGGTERMPVQVALLPGSRAVCRLAFAVVLMNGVDPSIDHSAAQARAEVVGDYAASHRRWIRWLIQGCIPMVFVGEE